MCLNISSAQIRTESFRFGSYSRILTPVMRHGANVVFTLYLCGPNECLRTTAKTLSLGSTPAASTIRNFGRQNFSAHAGVSTVSGGRSLHSERLFHCRFCVNDSEHPQSHPPIAF